MRIVFKSLESGEQGSVYLDEKTGYAVPDDWATQFLLNNPPRELVAAGQEQAEIPLSEGKKYLGTLLVTYGRGTYAWAELDEDPTTSTIPSEKDEEADRASMLETDEPPEAEEQKPEAEDS